MTDTTMEKKEPTSPDFGMVQLLHRGNDGYITFHRKDASGNFCNLASVKPRDLDGVFPEMLPVLETDSYFSVNAFFRPGWGHSRHFPKLPNAYRDGKGLRWLTCAFADLDGHHQGLTVGKMLGTVFDAQAAGTIPAVSLFQFSGRGLWCYWMLHDEDGGPVRAWPERIALWGAVQRAIGERVIAADPMARDVSRVTRIAGSINSKAATRVAYSVQADAEGKPFTYTLDHLADLLNVRLKPMAAEVLAIDSKMSELGKRGAAGRWRHDLQRFRTLWEFRGTWQKGLRAKAAFVYAAILRSLRGADKLTEDTIHEELVRLWGDFEQPADDQFPKTHVLNIPKAGRPLRHQTISDYLDVTVAEANMTGWPAASQECHLPAVKGPTRLEVQKLRTNALEAFIKAKGGRVPTSRALAGYLASIGLEAAPATVLTDLKKAGFVIPRKRSKKSARRHVPKLFAD